MSKKTTKRFGKLLEKVDTTKVYSLAEAIDTVKLLKSAKFDETVEIALKLNVDPRHALPQWRKPILHFWLLGR